MPQSLSSLSPDAVADATALNESEIRTLVDLYEQRLARSPEAVACRWFDSASGEWTQCDWRALQQLQRRYRAAFQSAGLLPGERVAVQIANGPHWLAVDWALQSLGLVMVSVYNEDTPGNTAHLLANSGAALALLRQADSWTAARALQRFPLLRQVVIAQDELPDHCGDALIDVLRVVDWLPPAPPETDTPAVDSVDADALASIVYTSGSTGPSRGVMLSHRNLLSNVFACLRALPVSADDCFFSVLPLANLFERVAGAYGAIVAGASTAYARGPLLLAEDLPTLKPTVLIGVPRVYERVHAAVMAAVEQGAAPRRALFALALQAGWAAHRANGVNRRRLVSAVARRAQDQLSAALGGRLRLAISGGAPLAPEVARLFIGLGVPLLQGYGLTEAGPVVSVNRIDDNDPNSAGLPLDNVETKLSPDNELMVRSPSVMLGYWDDAEATAQALDDAGWLRTGDKVSRLEAHRVYLTGRIKEIIVTSTGRKVSPSEIEQCLLAEPLVEQAMVVGEAKPFLTALIVPRPSALLALRAQLNLAGDDDSAPVRERLEAAALERCLRRLSCGETHTLLRAVALVEGPWTVASGLLTPTLKLRRSSIARQHADDLERLYRGHFLPSPTDCSCNASV